MKVIKVLGCPGSGKTRWLAKYIENNIDKLGYTLITSFTRSARDSLKSKLSEEILKNENIRITTLHSFISRELQIKEFLTQSKIQHMFHQLGIPYEPVEANVEIYRSIEFLPTETLGNVLYSHFSIQKLLDEPPERYVKHAFIPVSPQDYISIFNKFDALLQETGYDYTDILVEGKNRYRGVFDTVIIDEFQDITPLMWKIIQNINIRKTLLVAGDIDQNIFEWAGSTPEIMLNLKADETIRLTNSIRCSRAVAARAMELISKNMVRDKHMFIKGMHNEGHVQYIDYKNIFRFINPKRQTLILTYYINDFEELYKKLFHNGILCTRLDGKDTTPTNLVTTYIFLKMLAKKENFRVNKQNVDTVIDAIKGSITERYGGRDMLKKFFSASIFNTNDLKDMPFFRIITDYVKKGLIKEILTKEKQMQFDKWKKNFEQGIFGTNPNVRIGTIHTVKGLEAQDVFLHFDAACIDGNDVEYFRRVKYTGMTRAKNNLYICKPDTLQ
jgi:DNA helicase-2/ATP-dependent DNA helicase PcrA